MKKQFERCIKAVIVFSSFIVMAGALSSAHAQLPPVQSQGSVEYMSGGIGINESRAMRSAARDFELELVFSEREGNRAAYLANIDVDIRDMQGRSVLKTTSKGPYMLVRLPAGQYEVSASRQGSVMTRRVNVNHYSTARAVFEWQRM